MDSFLFRRIPRSRRTLNLSVIIIRCATPWWLSIIPYPDSRVQREALDCPQEVLHGLYIGARASLVENEILSIRPLDKPDQTLLFSSSESRRSEAFWLIASPQLHVNPFFSLSTMKLSRIVAHKILIPHRGNQGRLKEGIPKIGFASLRNLQVSGGHIFITKLILTYFHYHDIHS